MNSSPGEPPPDALAPPCGTWRRRLGRLRWVVNLWLVLHITAVIVAPAAVSPSSDLVRSAWTLFRPYLESLCLNNGYHYFAPEPGPGTLLGFVAEREDGSTIRGRIPNRDIEPRLLYHRHFMLAEHMDLASPPLQELWFGSYARHLGRKYGATKVGLTRVTHRLPTPDAIRKGVQLDDPASYDEQPLGVFPCDDSPAR